MRTVAVDLNAMRIIGHRGAAAVAPENTLASFRAAAALGVRWVEMDVSRLGDGTAVIFHDEELDRCTNGHGLLCNTDLNTLRTLDAGGRFSAAFAGERVPTLPEALTELQRLGLGLNLEIKHEGPGLEQLVAVVLDTLATQWRDDDQLLISSFNHQALRLCRSMAPHLRRGQLYASIPENWRQELSDIAAYSLHCDYLALDASLTHAIKQAGYHLFCYTVNDPAAAVQHWAWGVDGIFTDDPGRFIGLALM